MRKKIVAGNWKMNLNYNEAKGLAEEIVSRIKNSDENKVSILMPPFPHLGAVELITGGYSVRLGAQNCHHEESGAYTGEVSAQMLKSVGCSYCLIGHSERRMYNHETDQERTAKLKHLLSSEIHPIFCCGEELVDRKTKSHFDKVAEQLEMLWKLDVADFKKITIAYEPVWAIGTGETATAEQAQEIHAFIRGLIEEYISVELAENTSILYGGSCKPTNAKEIFSKKDVDGGLIGGASLNADDFIAIFNAL